VPSLLLFLVLKSEMMLMHGFLVLELLEHLDGSLALLHELLMDCVLVHNSRCLPLDGL
jgi:hypothetical protein